MFADKELKEAAFSPLFLVQLLFVLETSTYEHKLLRLSFAYSLCYQMLVFPAEAGSWVMKLDFVLCFVFVPILNLLIEVMSHLRVGLFLPLGGLDLLSSSTSQAVQACWT